MSYAPDYTPGTSFANDEANNVAGRSLVKTDSLDTELANISTSINDLNDNLQSIQRDDNKLKDSIVEPYALSEQTRALIAVAGCNPRGTWTTNTDYYYKDVIQRNNIAQICIKQEPHNSGSTFTQSFWLPISGDGTSAANAAAAAASAAAASTSEGNATNSAAAAAASSSAASSSAISASTAAINAGNSASSANTSETNAANSASEASTSAASAAASAASITAPKNSTNDPTFSSTSPNDVSSPEWVNGRIAAFLNSRKYVSSEQAITTAGSLTLAHGLSQEPTKFSLRLICKTAEAGYSVGDKIFMNIVDLSAASSRGVSVVPDSTNLNIRYGSAGVFTANNKTTGAIAGLTNANWRAIFTAEI